MKNVLKLRARFLELDCKCADMSERSTVDLFYMSCKQLRCLRLCSTCVDLVTRKKLTC